MHSGELSASQACAVYTQVRPMLHYLHELKERMEKRQFPASDKLYLEVSAAYYSIHVLAQDLHARAAVGYNVDS